MSAPWVIGGLAVIAVVALGAALVARWALANRADPADVDLASALRHYTDQSGHVDVPPGERSTP